MIFQVDDNSVKFLGDDNEVKGAVLFPDAEDGVVDIKRLARRPGSRAAMRKRGSRSIRSTRAL